MNVSCLLPVCPHLSLSRLYLRRLFHVFPRFDSFYVFPRFSRVPCFPAVVCDYLFHRTCRLSKLVKLVKPVKHIVPLLLSSYSKMDVACTLIRLLVIVMKVFWNILWCLICSMTFLLIFLLNFFGVVVKTF